MSGVPHILSFSLSTSQPTSLPSLLLTNIFQLVSRPTPHLEDLAHEYALTQGSIKRAKQKFADVTTGMRLRYLEWPNTGSDVVLLLHGMAGCAEVWSDIAKKLSDRGYKAIALDLRGHGGSSRSGNGRYSASLLADDVRAFIIAKDLYVRPVALVGHGIGAITALELAWQAPSLIGAVACIEFGLQSDLIQAVAAGCLGAEGAAPSSSASLLPWWSFWLGQGGEFASLHECAAFLCHPLANIGPVMLPSLVAALKAANQGDGTSPGETANSSSSGGQRVSDILSKLNRPQRGATKEAAAILRLDSRTAWAETLQSLPLKMDPNFFFSFDLASLVRSLPSLRAHLLVLHGESSPMVAPADAAALAAICGNAASATAVQVPQGGHHLVTDAANDVHDALVAFLEGPAVQCFDVAPGDGARRPETLGLRPLPQYASLEEAQKALGPRSVPTLEVVENTLRALRMEAGGNASESDDEGTSSARRHQTALAKDSPDYFGFVG